MLILAACVYILGAAWWAYRLVMAARLNHETLARLGSEERLVVGVTLALLVLAWPVVVPIAFVAAVVDETRKAMAVRRRRQRRRARKAAP